MIEYQVELEAGCFKVSFRSDTPLFLSKVTDDTIILSERQVTNADIVWKVEAGKRRAES